MRVFFVFYDKNIRISPISLTNNKPICSSNINHKALKINIIHTMLFTCGVQHGSKQHLRFCIFFFHIKCHNGHHRMHARFKDMCSKNCPIMDSFYMIKNHLRRLQIYKGHFPHHITTRSIHGWGTTFRTKDLRNMSHWTWCSLLFIII